MLKSHRSLLSQLAWGNVVFHLAALALTWFCIRPGSPDFGLETRQTYLAAHSLLWSTAWGLWMLCALLQVAFYAELARWLPQCQNFVHLAMSIACAGMAVDLLCDTIWMTIIPRLAVEGTKSKDIFLVVERLAAAGGLVVANGLYVLAAFILTLCLRHRQSLVPGTLLAGYAVFVFGMLLTAAGLIGSQSLAELATGPTILSFCIWVVLATQSVRTNGQILTTENG